MIQKKNKRCKNSIRKSKPKLTLVVCSSMISFSFWYTFLDFWGPKIDGLENWLEALLNARDLSVDLGQMLHLISGACSK
jgi:hypothetical protein